MLNANDIQLTQYATMLEFTKEELVDIVNNGRMNNSDIMILQSRDKKSIHLSILTDKEDGVVVRHYPLATVK